MIGNARELLYRCLFHYKASTKPRGASKGQQLKAMGVQLLQLTRSNQLKESFKLLNKMQEEVGKSFSHIYSNFLNNKMLVEYHFRRYGNVEMTLLNAISYNKIVFQHEHINELKLKLAILHFIYKKHKLPDAIHGLNYQEEEIEQSWIRKVKYYEALSFLYRKDHTLVRNSLFELLNSYPSTSIDKLKTQCIIALLTLKQLYPNAQEDKELVECSRMVYKSLLKGQKIADNLINKASTVDLMNCLMSYEQEDEIQLHEVPSDRLNPIYLNLTRLLAENLIMKKDYQEADKYLRFIHPRHIHRNFLEAVKLVDSKSYTNAVEFISENIFKDDDQHLPETDNVRYDAYKLLEIAVRETKTGNWEEVEYEAELFRVMHNLDLETKHIHFFNVPFRSTFSLDNFTA